MELKISWKDIENHVFDDSGIHNEGKPNVKLWFVKGYAINHLTAKLVLLGIGGVDHSQYENSITINIPEHVKFSYDSEFVKFEV
ncbi:MAG: hypothetical protein U0Y08_14930 [Bacteroidia bacterium]